MKKTSKARPPVYEGWMKFLSKPSALISDWIKQEKVYLKKNIKKNSIVLDVGCGFGGDIKAIVDLAKKIVGVDWDALAIETAEKNLSRFKNIQLFKEDAAKLHFKDNSFDHTICMGNTLGNCGNKKIKILKEMKRVTKKNGEIIISVYSESALPVRIENYKSAGLKIKKVSKDGTVLMENKVVSEQFSKNKLKDIFEKAGLSSDIAELGSIYYVCKLK